MRTFLLSFFLMACFYGQIQAQCDTIFNKRLVLDSARLNNNTVFSKVLPLDSTVILFSFSYDYEYKRVMVFAVIDTCDGSIIQQAGVIHPNAPFNFSEDIAFAPDKKEIIIFGSAIRDSICQMRYDLIKNEISYKTYAQLYSHTMSYITSSRYASTPDSGYICAYGFASDSLETELFTIGLLRLDKNGAVLWHKTTTTLHPCVNTPHSIIPALGGGYFIAGSLQGQSPSSPEYNNAFIIKINEQGEVLKRYDTVNENLLGYYSNLCQTSDGSLLVAGRSFNSNEEVAHQILKFNPNLELVWERKIGNGIYNNFNSVRKVIEANEKDGYIAIGSLLTDNGVDVWQMNGFIEKVDTAGNTVWIKELSGTPPEIFVEVQLLAGIQPTSGGDGYWLSGTSNNSELPPPVGGAAWLVKVDNNGNDTLSNQGMVSSAPSMQVSASAGLKIYPNPNTGSQLALDLSPWEGQVSIQILDVLGRTVYQQTKVNAGAERNLSYSNLPNGFYTVLVLQEGRKLASAPLLIK